jgi:ABC-2 type transport system permease protein
MGMFVALGAFLVVQQLSAEREDGTLLRAKATPNGIRGYLIGKFVTASGTVLAYLAILLIPGLLVLSGLIIDGGRTWLTLAWVGLLGLLATQSVGALLGSLISGPRGAGLLSLPIIALIAISGIFYPIVALPGWVQWVAQAFPIYWLGLGMRSALLALGSWAVAGLVLAPIVLRRTARRESGSALADPPREKPTALRWRM